MKNKIIIVISLICAIIPVKLFAQPQKGSDYPTVNHANIAVFLIDFPDTKDSIRALYPSVEEIRKELFDSTQTIQKYLKTMSSGKFKLTGDIFGPFTHQDSINEENDYQKAPELTINTIIIPNFQISDYTEFVFISFNDWSAGGCSFKSNNTTMLINGEMIVIPDYVRMGIAIGPPYRDETLGNFSNHFTDDMMSQIFVPLNEKLNGEYFFPNYSGITVFQRVFIHELIHTLGVWNHANSKTNGNQYSFESEIPNNHDYLTFEYGNLIDMMGKGEWGNSINGGVRDLLGWTDNTNRIKLDTYSKQRIRLYPINRKDSPRICEIRLPDRYYSRDIAKDFLDFPENGRKNIGYFLEVREPDKWDSTLLHPSINANTSGIILLETDGWVTYLLDASPSLNLDYDWGSFPDLRDISLKPGMIYKTSNVCFSNIEKHNDGSFSVDVQIFDPSDPERLIPVARAGSAQSVNEGETITLDGSTSSDPEGKILAYKWTPPKGVSLSSTTDVTPTFIAPEVNIDTNYTFSLVVNNGTIDSSIDQALVTVKNIKTNSENYMIICPDLLYELALKLKEYRETTGYIVSIKKLSTILNGESNEAERIDAWIEDYYTNNSLEFIVLLGTTDLIPTYFSSYEGKKFDSDLWYSVPNDSLNAKYLPEVSIGRIPVKDEKEFSNYFEKIKYFETSPKNRNTILFFGNAAEMSYAINRDIPIAKSLGFNTISLIDPTEADLFDTLNTSPLIAVIYYGHGSVLANGYLYTLNLSNWKNNTNPVLYFSGGCDFNNNIYNPNLLIEPLGDFLVTQPNGSIMSTGASIDGGYGYDYSFIEGILKEIKNTKTIGKLYNNALGYQYDINPDKSIGSWSYFFTRRMNIAGDPGLILNPPQIPDVSTISVSYSTPTSTLVKGNITSNEGGNIIEKGICWSSTGIPVITDSKTSEGTGYGEFTSNIKGLSSNTTYHFRAFATNDLGTGYGDVIKFTTLNKIPFAESGSDQLVNEGTTVTLNGSASSDSDGNPLTYLWIAPVGITLSSTTDVEPTFVAPEVKKDTLLNFSLIVNNGLISSEPSTVQIFVKDLINVGSNALTDNSIKVYPNPFTKELIIEFEGNTTNTDFEILNSLGQLVIKGVMQEREVVKTNNYTPGMYLVKLKRGNSFEFSKIIKK